MVENYKEITNIDLKVTMHFFLMFINKFFNITFLFVHVPTQKYWVVKSVINVKYHKALMLVQFNFTFWFSIDIIEQLPSLIILICTTQLFLRYDKRCHAIKFLINLKNQHEIMFNLSIKGHLQGDDSRAMADPGFDLTGAWTLSMWEGIVGRKSLKVLTVLVYHFYPHIVINILF